MHEFFGIEEGGYIAMPRIASVTADTTPFTKLAFAVGPSRVMLLESNPTVSMVCIPVVGSSDSPSAIPHRKPHGMGRNSATISALEDWRSPLPEPHPYWLRLEDHV